MLFTTVKSVIQWISNKNEVIPIDRHLRNFGMVVRRCVSMIMMRVLMTLAALASASAFAVTPARWVGPHKVFGAGRALTPRLRVAAPPVVTRLALQNRDETSEF